MDRQWLDDRAFQRWRTRCQSAMQTRPDSLPRTSYMVDRYNVQRHLPLRSVLEVKGENKAETSKSGEAGSSGSWLWGWFGRKDQSSASSSKPTSISSPPTADGAEPISEKPRGVFDEFLETLEPNEETDRDRSLRQRSEKYLDKLMRNSPMVRFMVKNLQIVGCSPFDGEGNLDKVLIARCPDAIAGGFMPSPEGQDKSRCGILLCHNAIIDKDHMERTIAHEMLHWFDHCRFRADWSDLRHVACSEIRAASLSGDCRFFTDLKRLNFGVRKHHQTCVRRRAIASMLGHPSQPDKAEAGRLVDEVWESCFNDTRPFDEIY